MKIFAGLLILCLAATIHGAPRIVGGGDAPEGKYPYQVSIQVVTGEHFCGGSILDERYILTAAHCLWDENSNRPINPILMQVQVGINEVGDPRSVPYSIEKHVVHGKYDTVNIVNDIGLIKLSRDIVFNERIQPIKLPTADSYVEGQAANLTGWGYIKYTNPSGEAPKKLQELEVKLLNLNKCNDIWKSLPVVGVPTIYDSEICTLTKKGEGACLGDSGGPLVVDGVQIGIVSFGIPCGVGVPDVYTKVYKYVDWINSTRNQFNVEENEKDNGNNASQSNSYNLSLIIAGFIALFLH